MSKQKLVPFSVSIQPQIIMQPIQKPTTSNANKAFTKCFDIIIVTGR